MLDECTALPCLLAVPVAHGPPVLIEFSQITNKINDL